MATTATARSIIDDLAGHGITLLPEGQQIKAIGVISNEQRKTIKDNRTAILHELSQFSVEYMKVTPQMASDMLSKNTMNRPIKQHHLDMLCKEIQSGRWIFNGAPIRFSSEGLLLDGQHRLKAIIITGTALDMTIIKGLSKEAFKTIDTNAVRTAKDLFSMHKEPNFRRLPSVLKLIKSILTDNPYNKSDWAKISNSEMEELLNKFPSVRDCISHSKTNLLSPSIQSAILYLASFLDKDFAYAFIQAFNDGTGLVRNEPVYWLRERMVKNAASKAKLPLKEALALTIKAWNAFYNGNSLKVLKWNPVEPFPVIKDLDYARLFEKGEKGYEDFDGIKRQKVR